MAEETAKTTNETPTQPQAVPQITAGDLALLVKVIDAGAERGAWKGEEMGTIGNIRSKLVAIVKSVAPVQDTVAETGATEEAPEETVATEEVTDTKAKRKRGTKSAA